LRGRLVLFLFYCLADIKAQAAQHWVNAVNADGRFGAWGYAMARKPEEVAAKITEA